jgi:hypothetical protein
VYEQVGHVNNFSNDSKPPLDKKKKSKICLSIMLYKIRITLALKKIQIQNKNYLKLYLSNIHKKYIF